MKSKKRYPCPCCGYFTLDEKSPGSFEICPVCYWQDDGQQFDNPTYAGGANELSLSEARLNFQKYGAISREFIDVVRPPLDEEKPPKY